MPVRAVFVVVAVLAVLASARRARAQSQPGGPPPDAPPPSRDPGRGANGGGANGGEAAGGAASGVVVRGAVVRDRTAAEYVLPVGTLAAVPRVNGGELLTLAPGVSISNDGNEGHAQHVYLRGFAGEDGQAIAFTLDGVPLNDEGNPEAQGYTDLHFILPELVDRLNVAHGVADPRAGNFAIAGAIDYHLALRQRGITVRGALGMYGYRRLVALWGPARASNETFVGAEIVHGDGYGARRRFDRASAMAQWAFALGPSVTARVFASAYTADWDSPGVVREDDVQAGRVDFYGGYPAAGPQGGQSTRAMLTAAIDWRGERARAELRAFGVLREHTLREDFTGFVEHPAQGDLIGYRYSGGTFGANGYYRQSIVLGGRSQDLEAGFFARHDRYTGSGTQLEAATGQAPPTADPADFAADARVTDVAMYLDVTTRPLPGLTLRGGVRADGIAFDVDGTTHADDGTPARRHLNAFTTHVGPKATVDLNFGRGWVALLSFGRGFRTPETLGVLEGDGRIPLEQVTGEELGVRYAAPRGLAGPLRLVTSLVAFHTEVRRDVLFDPTAGRDVPLGRTRRVGGVYWIRVSPIAWLDVNASVTYTYALADDAALGGQLPAGALLPYLPPLVARLDAAADGEVARWGRFPVRVRGGLGAGLRSAPALLANASGDPTFVLDGSAGVRVGPVGFDLNARNVLGLQWRDAQFEHVSVFTPNTPPGPPVRHFTAGTPLSVFGMLSVYY